MYQSFSVEINMPWWKQKDSTIFINDLKNTTKIKGTLYWLQLISKYWECIIQYGKYNSHCMLYIKAVKRANPNRSHNKK